MLVPRYADRRWDAAPPAKDMSGPDWRGLLSGLLKFIATDAQPALATSPNSAIPTAAGVMLVDPTQHVLFVKRSSTGDHAGKWAFPGGGCHPGETTAECARRETQEETGHELADDDALEELCRHSGDVNYTTYRAYCDNRFNPALNEEHTAHQWAPWGQWPSPLHPGVEQVLDGLSNDDLGEDAEFEEGKHPRDHGKFSTNVNGGNAERNDNSGEYTSPEHKEFQEAAYFDKEVKLEDNSIMPKIKSNPKQCTQEAMRRHAEGAELHLGQAIDKGSYKKSFDWWKEHGVVSPMYQFAHAWNVKDGKIIDGALGSKEAPNYLYFGVKIPDEHLTDIKDGDDLARNHFKLLRAAAANNDVAKDTTLHSSGPGGYLRQRANSTEMLPLTTQELRDDDVSRVHAHPGPKYNGSEAADMALDRASVRAKDADGRLHVKVSNISRSAVNEYLGHEIPDFEKLRLDPNRRYKLFRDPTEIAKAVSTFQNLPVLSKHVPVSAVNYQPDLVIGSTGTDAEFVEPFLRCSLVIWAKPAIDAIESGESRELSSAYRYVAVPESGTYEGQSYDLRMTQLIGNHVALVRAGRAGSDVAIGDSLLSQDREWEVLERALLTLT